MRISARGIWSFAAACFGVAAALAVLTPQTSQAAAKEKVIIVIDSSGSMAGRVQGVRKIDIARRAIRDLVKTWSPQIDLGLIAYGHRRKGDCRDIQTLHPVGKVDPQQILRAVQRLMPRGKTPLGAAVLLAAKRLRYTEDKATVILVSDGKENCGVDVCKLASELEEQGLAFTAHVIGFDIKRGQERGLKCLAKNTGGRYFTAKNAKELARALRRTVQEVQQTVTPPPQPVAKEQGVELVAVYMKGGKPFEGQMGWTLFNPKRDLTGKRKKIASAWLVKSGHIFRKIPPGKYVVQAVLADHPHIVREGVIEVRAKEAATYVVVLNIGKVRFGAKLATGSEPYSGTLGWRVVAPKADLSGKRKLIAEFWDEKSGKVYILPAGKWIVQAQLVEWRYVRTKKAITVEPGGAATHLFVFNAGKVRFDTALSAGGPAYKGTLGWKILSTKADLSGKRKLIAEFWDEKSGKVYILPAGDWLVKGELVTYRHVRASKAISIAPGSGTAHAFNFRAAQVRVNVTINGRPFKGRVGWDVYGQVSGTLEKKRPKITGAWDELSGHLTIVHEGAYLLTAVNVNDPKQTGKTKLSVTAGKSQAISVDLRKK